MTRPPTVPPTEPALPEGARSERARSERARSERARSEGARSEGATFEVVGGAATAEEIAALTAVLAAMAAAAGERDAVLAAGGRVGVSGWAERSSLVRRPLSHATGGWRASARPT
jgi:Acyl-CoA carboxylase epsilon subunit